MATPWGRIKARYLKGDITYRELAEKYHLSEKTVRNRAYKEGWAKEKDIVRAEAGQKAIERVVRVRARELETLMIANESLAAALLELVKKIAEDPMMLMGRGMDGRAADSISKAINTTALTQRDLYMIPNLDQKFAKSKESQRKREAKQKYDLEKAKWEAEQAEKAKQTEFAGGTVWKVELPEGTGPVDE